MFRVKVTGEYVARSGVMDKEKIKKSYEIEGNIPSTYAALSVVKNKLLVPALTKKYPDFVTFLTYHIVEIIPLDAASIKEMKNQEVSFMDRETLLTFIRDNNIKVQDEFYPDLFRLREAVQFAKEDPEGYAKHFKFREADLKMDLEMARCNPDLFQEGAANTGLAASVKVQTQEPVFAPGEQRPSDAKAAKASKPEALAIKTENRLASMTADQMRDGDMGPMDTVPGENDSPAGDIPGAPDVGDL